MNIVIIRSIVKPTIMALMFLHFIVLEINLRVVLPIRMHLLVIEPRVIIVRQIIVVLDIKCSSHLLLVLNAFVFTSYQNIHILLFTAFKVIFELLVNRLLLIEVLFDIFECFFMTIDCLLLLFQMMVTNPHILIAITQLNNKRLLFPVVLVLPFQYIVLADNHCILSTIKCFLIMV